MTPIVFAFLTDAREAVAELVTGLLMVAGGFLVGYLLGGVLGWALGKWVFRQKQPDNLKRLGRPVGGVILALIVALIVFTGKGKGPGSGGGGGGTDTAGTKAGEPTTDAKKDSKLPPVKPPDVKPADSTIWLTIREGGSLTGPGKFYRLDDEDTARTLDELKAALADRKVKAAGRIVLAIRFEKDTELGDPRLMTDVTNWAKKAGLDVILPANK